jgi:glucose/arabinose dehydrogenase
VLAGVAAAALVVVTGCTSDPRTSTSTPTPPARGASPRVDVSTIESGLSYPWDLTFTPDGTMLFDERTGAIWARPPSGPRHNVAADLSDLFVGVESGLMGMVVDPDFTANRRFYTCQAYRGAGTDPIDIRVIRWTINERLHRRHPGRRAGGDRPSNHIRAAWRLPAALRPGRHCCTSAPVTR